MHGVSAPDASRQTRIPVFVLGTQAGLKSNRQMREIRWGVPWMLKIGEQVLQIGEQVLP